MINIDHQLDAVQRQVGDLTIEAGQASTVTVSQTFEAELEDAWDACTNPERIPRWFLPVTGDLREGGTYQLEGNAGGTVQRCEPPHSFGATWEFGGQISWIEVRLTSVAPDRTRVELQHIALVDDLAEHWVTFGPGAGGVGWDGAFLGLATHLGSGAAVDPGEAAAWMASEEGLRFYRSASFRWGEAHVAAGADQAAAAAAAERTAAFYTGADAPAE